MACKPSVKERGAGISGAPFEYSLLLSAHRFGLDKRKKVEFPGGKAAAGTAPYMEAPRWNGLTTPASPHGPRIVGALCTLNPSAGSVQVSHHAVPWGTKVTALGFVTRHW